MNSLILATATRFLKPLLLAFSVVILFRGHNDPGGGFVGGLAGAAAFSLQAISMDVRSARRALRVDPHVLTAAGLLLAGISGIVGMLFGEPFLTAQWIAGGIGTVLLFDIGVYLVVIGSVLLIVFELAECC
jgi:multicomponent Na+:H+ antiporter subunit B